MPCIIAKPESWSRINWFGVVAAILTISLPFFGMWWRLVLGTGVATVMVSPFGLDVNFFGKETITSPLAWWIGLALKISVVYLGALLLIGSILPASERYESLAKLLVHFSSRKLLWLVVMFAAVLLSILMLVNHLPEILSSFGEMPFKLQTNLPYLPGEGSASIEMEGVHLTIPIFAGFTHAFAAAVLASLLGIASRIYNKRRYNKKGGSDAEIERLE